MHFINLGSYNSQFRGLDYFEEKKVIEYEKVNSNQYKSKVKGSYGSVYDVMIDVDHPRRSTCNCEHANGRRVVCKHMIATYFTVFPFKVQEFHDDLERMNHEYEEEMQRRRDEREKQVKEYVNSLSAKEVRKELIRLLMEEYDESINHNYW